MSDNDSDKDESVTTEPLVTTPLVTEESPVDKRRPWPEDLAPLGRPQWGGELGLLWCEVNDRRPTAHKSISDYRGQLEGKRKRRKPKQDKAKKK